MGGGGGSPSTTTQNVVQSTQLPQWYADYLQQVMGKAVGAANENYQPYTGQTVAGTTADQQAAYGQVRDIAGTPDPMLGQAGAAYDAAISGAGADTGAAGAGQFGAANMLFGQGAQANSLGAFSPYANQAASSAAGASGAASPYIQGSTAPIGLAAASPYLNAASGSLPQNISSYMNPYNSAVTDQIAKLGARNLSENILPAIGDQFVSSGQYGSQRQGVLDDRALRDTQDSILSQQNAALQAGYNTAGQQYQTDAARQAQLAGTAGGLGTSQQQILQSAGSTLGNLGLGQASVYSGLGSTAGGLSSADASRQIAAAQGLSGIGQSQIQAAQTDAARQLQAQLSAAQGYSSLAQQNQNMGLQGAAALQSIGSEQQQQNQTGLNAAYSQFQQQQQYPWQQIGNLSNVIQGLPVNTSSSTNTTTQTPQPSALGQIAGVGLGVAGLAGSGIFKARGGAVKKKSRASYGVAPSRGLSFYARAA